MLNKILITSIGGGLGAELANQIKKTTKFKNIVIIGVDIIRQTPSRYFVDKFYQVPSPTKKNYISKILKIIKKDKINLVIPGSDLEAINLCKKRDQFENEKCFLASVDLKILSNFITKEKTYQSLKKNNLPCAEFNIAKNWNELLSYIKKFDKQEFVIKPSVSIGGRDVSVYRNDLSKTCFFNDKKEIHYPNKRKNLLLIRKNILENIH